MRKTGKVVTLNTSTGEGTIKSVDGTIVNFSISNVIGKELPEYSSEVEFEENDGQALNVLVISDSSKNIGTPNIVISNNNNNNNNNNFVAPVFVDNKPSWLKIILWFIFFWPIGVYYLIKRATA